MCGIFGLLDVRLGNGEWESTLWQGVNRLVHRGPDDAGIWYNPFASIGLGQRRLSIVDLTSSGHQPMLSANERYVITFNGEIYNFQQLKKELRPLGYPFKGTSDTEVLLAGFEHWGIEQTIRRTNGMFAFGVWDQIENRLYLGRDRIGEKPLYYGRVGGAFVFSSELKAMRALRQFNNPINRNALALYFRHECIPAPYSIYENIYKLPPGTILCVSVENQNCELTPVPYWSAQEAALGGQREVVKTSREDAIDQLDALLRDAIKLRMIADVPLGAFLSGGIDSSTIVALMQAQSSRPVRTFSIGFGEPEYNEAVYAKTVAQHLGTDHTELYVMPEKALAVIPLLPKLYDEPFSDSSQIPTFLISELARQQVTVGLSGDGGDELFAGYARYSFAQNIWEKRNLIPAPFRNLLAKILTRIPHNLIEKTAFSPVLGSNVRPGSAYDQIQKLIEILNYKNSHELYRRITTHWKKPFDLVIGANELLVSSYLQKCLIDLPEFTHRMMYSDMISYLPDDILVKVDRASMGVSLEARVPLLDHRLVEFAWKLPLNFKIYNGQSKWILRQVLYRYVPREMIERPKRGFSVPIGSWLRGPLRDWAETLLDERKIYSQGYLNPVPIRKFWSEHLSGQQNWEFYLWDVLMFQAWLEHKN